MRCLALLGLVVIAACPAPPPSTTTSTPPPSMTPAPTPTPTQSGSTAELTSKDACTADADCVITSFSGCCACPGCDQPAARSSKELAASQKQCELVRCDMDRCKAMLCKAGEPTTSFTAACENQVCVGRRK